MGTIISPPSIVCKAMSEFINDLFMNNSQRQHCANYLTGLLVGGNKTVTGITDELLNASDQSCLNRFLNSIDWDHEKLNDARIDWLQNNDTTCFNSRGIIALDDVLIEKTGTSIEDVGYLYDHTQKRTILAHDLLFVHYVNMKNGKHYPLEFRRFKKESQCTEEEVDFKKQTELFRELVGWCNQHSVPGTFVFDSHYSSNEDLNYINSLKDKSGQVRGYVGDVISNRTIIFKGKRQTIRDFATTIPPSDRKAMTVIGADGKKRTQYFLTVNVNMPHVDHPVRIVIIWKHKKDIEAVKFLVTNRIHWNGDKSVQIYRYRWTGTETFHRDAKQELGLGDCQLRNGVGQTRHTYLVMLAYSLLVRELDNGSLNEWCREKFVTIGEACRMLLSESIRNMVTWLMEKLDVTLNGHT